MKRTMSSSSSFVLVALLALATLTLGPAPAQAAPLPAAYTAGGTASVARVTTTLLGIPVTGLGVAQSVDAVDSGATPRAAATSRNVSASVVGLPISVVSGSQTAPPDHTTASTGTLVGVDAGILSLGALERSNLARWAGDTACVAQGPLTQTSTQTAGLSVSGLLDLGVSTATTSTSLTTGSGALNKAVRSTSSGSLSGISLLGGAVTVSLSRQPALSATATGVAGGAVVQRNNPVVTVTGPGGPVVLQLGDTTSTTVSVPLVGSVTVGLNPPSSIVQAADGRSASATWNFLDVDASLLAGAGRVQATLLPLQASATAPAGGIDCPPPAPVIDAPAEGATTGPLPTVRGTAVPGATVAVTVDGAAAGTVTADGSGAWQYTRPAGSPLAEGAHTVSATQTVAGATGPSTADRTFRVDATAPVAPVVTAPADGSRTGDSTPAYSGTAEAGSTVEVLVDGSSVGTTTASGTGAWSLTQPSTLGDGPHTVAARATDAVGNTGPVSATNTFTVDTTAPAAAVVTAPVDGATTTDSTPTYSGTAEAGSTVQVVVDGSPVGTTTADGSGAWTFTQPSALSDGVHQVAARATDAAGNTGPTSAANTFTVDTTAPAAPVVTTPANGSSTGDSTPAYAGTAEARSTVEVLVDGSPLGTTTADGSGAWTLTQPTALADGSHQVAARATDVAGNTGPTSAANTFTVDTAAPAAPVVTAPANGSRTGDSTPAYSGTAEAGSTVQVVVDGSPVGTTTASGTGAWSLTQPSTLGDGPHTVAARATDAAGNTGPTSAANTFTVDTTAPAAPVVTTPADGSRTGDSTPAYSGTAEAGSTVEVLVDGSSVGTTTADGSGAWTFTQPSTLGDGPHTVAARATDTAGNTGPTSAANTFTVDTTGPAAPVVTAPVAGSTVADDTPTLAGTAEPGSTVTVSVDTVVVGTTTADGNGAWTLTQPSALSEGDHVVSAHATDAQGNTGPESAPTGFTVDTTAPLAPVVTDPSSGAVTRDATPAYSGLSEPGSTVEVLVDGASVGTATADGSGAWSLTQPSALADGDHEVTARATDAVGNTGPLSAPNVFTVDTTAPAAPVVTTPADGAVTGDATPTYTGTAEAGSTVQVVVDGAPVGSATASGTGSWSLPQPSALADGDHEVTARATDTAGNTGPASAANTFTVDTEAPEAPVVTAPVDGSTIGDRAPTYRGTAEPGARVEVVVDGASVGSTTAGGDGSWSLIQPTGLADGPHTVRAAATDAAGNTGPASAGTTFVVDATAPAPPVITSPEGNPTYRGPDVGVTGRGEPGATVDLTATSGALVVTATATVTGGGTWSSTLTGLADGDWSVSAVQSDATGNTSGTSASETFVVDGTAPAAPVIDPLDPPVSRDATPTLTGSGEPGSSVTVLDTTTAASHGPVPVDAGGRWSLPVPALTEGDHVFTATQEDAAGNGSATSDPVPYTVDSRAPAAPVVLLPADDSIIADPTPVLSGTAEPGAEVTVRLDGRVVSTVTADGAGRWTVPTAEVLADGPHTVEAVARDAAGNVSPVGRSDFAVDTGSSTPVVTDPADGSVTRDATPLLGGTADAADTVTVLVDGSVVGTVVADGRGRWTLPTTTPLATGSHVVTARAVDPQGTVSATSAAVRFTVDTTAPDAPVVTSPVAGSSTADRTPPIRGTGEPGATVTVLVDGVPVGTAVVTPDGGWELTPATALVDGPHVASATQTDAAGNVSGSSATVRFTVESPAPAPPVITSPTDGSTVGAGPVTVRGTGEPGGGVVLRGDDSAVLGDTVVGPDGTFVLTVDLAAGTTTLVAVQTAGTVELLSSPVTVRVLEVVAGAEPPWPTGTPRPGTATGPLARTGAETGALLGLALALLGCGAALRLGARGRRGA